MSNPPPAAAVWILFVDHEIYDAGWVFEGAFSTAAKAREEAERLSKRTIEWEIESEWFNGNGDETYIIIRANVDTNWNRVARTEG